MSSSCTGENENSEIEQIARRNLGTKMAVFRAVHDGMVDRCAKEIVGRWSDKLGSADVYAESHCQTALVYARWDD